MDAELGGITVQTKRLNALRKNAQRRVLSNWFLAASLAVTGAGFLDISTDAPRFAWFEGLGLIGVGAMSLFASWRILSYLEEEELSDD